MEDIDWSQVWDFMKAQVEYEVRCNKTPFREAFMETLDTVGFVFFGEEENEKEKKKIKKEHPRQQKLWSTGASN